MSANRLNSSNVVETSHSRFRNFFAPLRFQLLEADRSKRNKAKRRPAGQSQLAALCRGPVRGFHAISQIRGVADSIDSAFGVFAGTGFSWNMSQPGCCRDW